MNSKNILALSFCLLSTIPTSVFAADRDNRNEPGEPGSGRSVVGSLLTYVVVPAIIGVGGMAIDRLTNLGELLRLPKSKADAELEKTQAKLAESERRTVIDILNAEEAQVSEKTKAKYREQNTSLTQEEQTALDTAEQLKRQQQDTLDTANRLQERTEQSARQITELQALITQDKRDISIYRQNANTHEQEADKQLQLAQKAKQQKDQLAEQENSELHTSTTQIEALRQSLLKLVGADTKTTNLEEAGATEATGLEEVDETAASLNPESRSRLL